MLKIKNLYKEKENKIIKAVNLEIKKGNSVGIECSNEISDLLVDIVLGKETKAKGEIYIEGIKNSNINYNEIGIIFRDDYYYENLTIEEYIKFFSNIFGNKIDYNEVLLKTALLDIKAVKINRLNYSQKRRLSFAREILKRPKVAILQEPVLHVDDFSKKIILENIEGLKKEETAILITSILVREVLKIGDKVYKLDEKGLVDLEGDKEELDTFVERTPIYKLGKITAKKGDRIWLFDPMEIDYIESINSISTLNVNGEQFPSTYSLNDLENKLETFGFFRCHRSYIVNLQRVREVVTYTRNSYSLSLDNLDKSILPLSKGRLENLKNILGL